MVYVDHDNFFNHLILNCLKLPLGEASVKILSSFEQYVSELGDYAQSIGMVNNYPIYIDAANGIIFAAVCGASGVAIRLPTYFTGKIIKDGGKDHLPYVGGQKRLITPFSQESTAWVLVNGGQNLDNIRRGLSAARSLLEAENATIIARKAAVRAVDINRPENASVLAYFKVLSAAAGSPSSDVMTYLFETLPQQAYIKPIRKTVENMLTMVHPETGIIFVFYHNEKLYLRLAEMLSTGKSTDVSSVSEMGVGWGSLPAFSAQNLILPLLTSAYQSAGRQ